MANEVSLPSDFADGGQLFVRNATGLVREGRPSLRWYAGPQPLNDRAARDLLNHGWLRFVRGSRAEVRIEAWPRFADAGPDPEPA